MPSTSRWIWISLSCAIAPGCTLVSLDALQSGAGGSASNANSSSTVMSSSALSGTGSTSSVTSSNSVGSSSESSSSGCGVFCAGQTGLVACGDFDTPATGIGADWGSDIALNGATTGSIAKDDSDSVSCPSAARLDMVGSTGDFSWVQLSNSITLASNSHVDIVGLVKRTGPSGALDSTSVLEADFPEAAGVTCQLFIKPSDGTNPSAFVFLQKYSSSAGAVQLTNKTLSLPGPTAEKWSTVELDFDWSVAPPIATAKVDGASVDLTFSSVCATKPSQVTAAWGMAYDDRTQTVLVDNVTARVH